MGARSQPLCLRLDNWLGDNVEGKVLAPECYLDEFARARKSFEYFDELLLLLVGLKICTRSLDGRLPHHSCGYHVGAGVFLSDTILLMFLVGILALACDDGKRDGYVPAKELLHDLLQVLLEGRWYLVGSVWVHVFVELVFSLAQLFVANRFRN